MKLAHRLSSIPPYLFMELRKKINAAKDAGVDVISLAIGDPVDPTPSSVIRILAAQAKNAENHRYPPNEELGMLEFRQAVADWYNQRYGIVLDPATEALGLLGSKEGIHHFCLARVNPGDTVLMTNPGYPAYRANILMMEAAPYDMPITEENDYLPDLGAIPMSIARRASAMLLNYPNNPTGAVATHAFFEDVVDFARSFDIAVLHDNPYSEVVFGKAGRLSFLQTPGARDVGVELNSLSKPYNMTGWRIGMAIGNPELIAGMAKVKENTDSGIFAPIQYAAVKALTEENEFIDKMMKKYAKRRKMALKVFRDLGWEHFNPNSGTFYLWLPAPDGMSSLQFTEYLFDRAAVVVAAGSAYGAYGEGYIRISLTVEDDLLREALARIQKALAGSGLKPSPPESPAPESPAPVEDDDDDADGGAEYIEEQESVEEPDEDEDE